MGHPKWFRAGLVGLGAALILCACQAATTTAVRDPLPLLAYYYIWFDVRSWERAKTDTPELGKYSSDNVQVMQEHVRRAKEAGIRGFIVSWKSTPRLNARLEKLIQVAQAENFKLAIIYQGLDFERDPLSAAQVAKDLAYFYEHYAASPVLRILDKPLVIWSGTWKFSRAEIAGVTQPWRGKLLILATEKNVKDYMRVADVVDGDAYYWSSVNPETFRGYPEKLAAMSQAVHAQHGVWIAPAAPGFDARLIGGTTVVERKNGETLRQQLNAALQSAPDLIGLISWNEFSENSHVEPSENYGSRYLDVLRDIQNARAPQILDFDSSAPARVMNQLYPDRLIALGLLGLLVLASAVVIARRSLHLSQRRR